jgi:hypothetical protein
MRWKHRFVKLCTAGGRSYDIFKNGVTCFVLYR